MQIPWQTIDWRILEELRAHYLNPGSHGVADYWGSAKHLEHYDYTFAQRIGWKWRAVIDELYTRYPQLSLVQQPRILDFGCGTGIATREWLRRLDDTSRCEIGLADRSTRAMQFARDKIAQEFGVKNIACWGTILRDHSWDVCLVSHVINEVGAKGVDLMVSLVQRSKLAVLVEPGTPKAAMALRAVREALLSTHQPLAPCTHSANCGMAAPERVNDWCHHFAKPPSEIFRDGGWTQFGKRMGVDLRSLPVSYLVLAPKDALVESVDTNRLIGRARVYKGYAKALVCDASGVHERQLQKRDDPELYKKLDKDHPFSIGLM